MQRLGISKVKDLKKNAGAEKRGDGPGTAHWSREGRAQQDSLLRAGFVGLFHQAQLR